MNNVKLIKVRKLKGRIFGHQEFFAEEAYYTFENIATKIIDDLKLHNLTSDFDVPIFYIFDEDQFLIFLKEPSESNMITEEYLKETFKNKKLKLTLEKYEKSFKDETILFDAGIAATATTEIVIKQYKNINFKRVIRCILGEISDDFKTENQKEICKNIKIKDSVYKKLISKVLKDIDRFYLYLDILSRNLNIKLSSLLLYVLFLKVFGKKNKKREKEKSKSYMYM